MTILDELRKIRDELATLTKAVDISISKMETELTSASAVDIGGDEWHDFMRSLSVRAYHGIQRAEIMSFKDLCSKTPCEVLFFHNVGQRTLAEIRTALQKRQLSLKE